MEKADNITVHNNYGLNYKKNVDKENQIKTFNKQLIV